MKQDDWDTQLAPKAAGLRRKANMTADTAVRQKVVHLLLYASRLAALGSLMNNVDSGGFWSPPLFAIDTHAMACWLRSRLEDSETLLTAFAEVSLAKRRLDGVRKFSLTAWRKCPAFIVSDLMDTEFIAFLGQIKLHKEQINFLLLNELRLIHQIPEQFPIEINPQKYQQHLRAAATSTALQYNYGLDIGRLKNSIIDAIGTFTFPIQVLDDIAAILARRLRGEWGSRKTLRSLVRLRIKHSESSELKKYLYQPISLSDLKEYEASFNEAIPAQCIICGKLAEHHHIKTRGSGGDDSASNILPLCRDHHQEVHAVGRKTFSDRYPVVGHLHEWAD